jgi:Sugar kinases, ribokinase family
MFDVCIIGPITRDIIRTQGVAPRIMPGGSVYYAGVAYRRLGLGTAAITRASRRDADELLQGLHKLGIKTRFLNGGNTTVFENCYTGCNQEVREQTVTSITKPFTESDLGDLTAKVFHLGPLTACDMSPDFLKAVMRRGARVCLDVQGFMRLVVDGKVRPTDWVDKRKGLGLIDVLKADLKEAQLLSGHEDPHEAAHVIAELGPREVIVTLGHQGSLVFGNNWFYRIPIFTPHQVVDTTGCGDTYFAGYISRRLQGDDIKTAAYFAAALATLKLERYGPFSGTEREVQTMLEGVIGWRSENRR